MKILIGTTNPSKVKRFESLLAGTGVLLCTPDDLEIDGEPEENGATPEENAIQKARFYGRFWDVVICNDSGLYFDELPIEDSRQPGLHVRTPGGVPRLDDEEMIRYYSKLIHSLGGRVSAYYLDGIAVYNQGEVYSFMDREGAKSWSFYMVDSPSANRHEGWPLDSLSVNRNTGAYFVDKKEDKFDSGEENIMVGEYWGRVTQFLADSLFNQEKEGDTDICFAR